jgi:hypothetical protein
MWYIPLPMRRLLDAWPPAWAGALSRVAPQLLALGAALALAAAVSVWNEVTRPRPENGFLRLQAPGTRCEPDTAWERRAARSIEPEPFVPEGEFPEACVIWRSFWVVRRPTRLELELESDDDGLVLLDGRPLVSEPGMHTRRAHAEIRDVEPGVHPIEVRLINRTGGAYLRIRMQDRREPYMAGVLPIERDDFFVSRIDAERALAAPHAPRRTPDRALGFALWLTLAGTLAWLAIRARRLAGEPALRRFALVDLGLGAGISAFALALRSGMVAETDIAWDELWYWNAGEHYVRNAMIGDWAAESFRWNAEHPPIAKWIYGLGGALGGLNGARHVGCVLSAISCGLLFAAGRVLFSRAAGAGAGLALALMPHVVAHGRLVGLETIVVFFWCANLLAVAVWLRSVEWGRPSTRLLHGDSLAAAAGAFVCFPGLLARFTYVWMALVVLYALVLGRRHAIRAGTLPLPIGALVGGAISLALCIALWPWIHTDPAGHLARTFGHWGGRVPTEYFLGERVVGPPFAYYPVLFVVTTPALAIAAALVGAGIGLRDHRTRAATGLVLVALLAPFLQGISSFRQDLARYVVQSWPEVALLAGLATAHLGRRLHARISTARPFLHRAARPALVLAPGLALALYLGAELRSVEPFPLDYYSEIVGGPGGVAERRLFDVSWWAEGVGHAVHWLNAHARPGARVRMDVSNWDVRPRLRDDLVEVPFRSQVPADYVVTNYHLYGDPPPAGCERIHHVAVRGAPLASVWECGAAQERP